ncbi:hypothetical protein ACFWG6_14245 [Streptomyces erythrochromogenes]|uniref:hypothetical protein n=1 Tax=Streptomyces erythrochromogenes TaxID=285574 RepID=UPI003639C9E6
MASYEGILNWTHCQSPRSNHNDPTRPELDVVTLRWDGEQVARRDMGTGETWTLDVARPLPGPATVEVVVRPNVDGSVEDVTGTVVLSEDLVGTGFPATDFHVAAFDEAGAQYELTYRVRTVPGPVDAPPPVA